MKRVLLRLLPALLVLVAGFAVGDRLAADDATTRPARPLVDLDTPELRDLRAAAGIDPCPRGPAVAGSSLPAVALPCLGGDGEVDLRSIEGPAVLNLWAGWCGPCREELPLLARLHERAGDRVQVVGIDWQDFQPAGALALARATGVTYPLLADPGDETSDAWRTGSGIPRTVFVDSAGDSTLHVGVIDDWDELVGLVRDHTGTQVPAG